MTTREAQLEEMPPEIEDTKSEAARIRMLKRIATELPKLAARSGIRVVGKGGTMLRLCEGIPRPSTDYDCDTDKPWERTSQARAVEQILKAALDAEDPVVTVPANRSKPVALAWTMETGPGTKERIESYINAKHVPELASDDFWKRHVRIREGMTTYTSARLYQGKADALMGRAAARDIYDIWYGLTHHLERIEPATRIQIDEQITEGLQELQIEEWQKNLDNDGVLRGAVTIEQMLLGVMDCLEKDPVVALHRQPDRTLGFFVDSDEKTISFGLSRTEDKPFVPLYTCPQEDSDTLCRFIIESQTDVWQTINVTKPSGGKQAEQSALCGIVRENIERWNARALGPS